MQKKKWMVVLALLISLVICLLMRWPQIVGLWQQWFEKGNGNGEAAVQLNVYLVAKESGGKNEQYRYTEYALGEFMALQTGYREDGYRYKTMLEEYQKENSVELIIEYFDCSDDLHAQLVEDKKEGKLPDLIIEDSISFDDAYALLDADILLDLSSYVQEDGLYDSGEYYNEVLQGGQYKGQQMILPLSFNMNTIMSSAESLERYNIDLSEAGLLDMLVQFTSQLHMMQQEDPQQELLAQFVAAEGDFPIRILLAAGGGTLVDYEEKKVQLDPEFYKEMAEFYKQFAIQEMGSLDAVIEQGTYLGLYQSVHGKRMGTAMRFEDMYRNTAAFIEGGSCSNIFIHSFAAQANYYESVYTDVGEEFCLYGIPTYGNSDEYTPMITSFGAIMANTEHPEAAYDFLKYMMDQPYFMHYELSVNRQATEEMLDQLSNTTYQLSQMRGYFENMSDSELSIDYVMSPLTEDTKQKILYLLDNMGKATLSNWPVYQIVQENMLLYVLDKCSIEESYEKCRKELNEYLNTFSLEGQLHDLIGYDYQ